MLLFRSIFLVVLVVFVLIIGVMMDQRTSRDLKSTIDTVCDGSTCGCFKEKCWVFVNESATNPDDWWCYAQRLQEEFGRRKKLQTCEVDRECSMDRDCYNCVRYKGDEDSTKTVC